MRRNIYFSLPDFISNNVEIADITREEVNRLITALEGLRTIERELVKILHDVTERRLRNNNHAEASANEEEVETAAESESDTSAGNNKGEVLLPYSKIRRNDFVRIKNPKTGQQRKGIATGATESRIYIKVVTPNQAVIKLTPRNLKVLTREEYERTHPW